MIGTIEAPEATLVQVVGSDTLLPTAGTWIEVVPHLDPKFGGVSAVVPQLASTLVASEHYAINLAAFCSAEEGDALTGNQVDAVTNWPASRLAWLRDWSLRRRFRELLSRADGVHIHGLWEASAGVTAYFARQLGKPYIISAHGMLEPWALANKGFKKNVYSALVERANIEGAACLHALTRAESNNYRDYGSKRPIAIIPNGVEIPRGVNGDLFLREFPVLRGKRIVLFLGRIHFKKGLDLLIDAWGALAWQFPDAVLVLAGPDAENSQAAIQRKVHLHGLEDRVMFTGMLGAEVKWSALAAADSFVLPSYSEGLSVAALEAMGIGLPVILTTHCHLPEVAECGAGFVVPAELPELYAALETLLSNAPAVNAEMGRRGRQLVEERFSWPVVARKMAGLYRWVQGGPSPRDVELLEVSA